jgi:hypothetical protein
LTCKFPKWHCWEGPETTVGSYGICCKEFQFQFNFNFNFLDHTVVDTVEGHPGPAQLMCVHHFPALAVRSMAAERGRHRKGELVVDSSPMSVGSVDVESGPCPAPVRRPLHQRAVDPRIRNLGLAYPKIQTFGSIESDTDMVSR